jgi:hypothetical protein
MDTAASIAMMASRFPKQALTPPPPGPSIKELAAKLNAAHNA